MRDDQKSRGGNAQKNGTSFDGKQNRTREKEWTQKTLLERKKQGSCRLKGAVATMRKRDPGFKEN